MAEMGPLESVGAPHALWILFFGVFVKALRSKSYGRALWLLGLAVVSALLALEEVSWGQNGYFSDISSQEAERPADGRCPGNVPIDG